MSVYEQTKKAVLSELKNNYELYIRVNEIYQVAEEAEQEAKQAIEQKKQEQAKQDKETIADIAKRKRIIKK